jgi:hypothetical protein
MQTRKLREDIMSSAAYRVESNFPIVGPLLPGLVTSRFFMLVDMAMAVVLAAKSFTYPPGQEIRVVHLPTGEVVYRKTAPDLSALSDDFFA